MLFKTLRCAFAALVMLAPMAASGQQTLKPWTKGGFETHQYRSVFAEMGYPQAEVDARLERIYQEVFCGPDKVYFEVGDDMGYMSDVKNFDARTEGMSYGMMIAVQLDKKDVFDRLFRWAKKYMQYQDGPMKGYFAWSLSPDGTIRGAGPASDGELYFITSLIFASNRWGNQGDINYLAEAQNILNCSWEKDGSEGIMPFINKENHLIIFTPDGRGVSYTDPSYHLPAFYEVWARWANDGRADFWRACATASREYLHKSIDPQTGLNPDTNNFDGSFIETPAFFGRRMKPAFRFDSWRVPMNIALDYSWACADREWQTNMPIRSRISSIRRGSIPLRTSTMWTGRRWSLRCRLAWVSSRARGPAIPWGLFRRWPLLRLRRIIRLRGSLPSASGTARTSRMRMVISMPITTASCVCSHLCT